MPFESREIQLWDGKSLRFWSDPRQGLPRLHWAHATGFSALTYLELFNQLEGKVAIDAWDMRGHGSNQNLATTQLHSGWETYYRDLCSYLDCIDEPVWLGGHSIGATISMIAASRMPDKVRGLVLCEPVLLPRNARWMLKIASLMGRSQSVGLAKSAKRRRAVFESRTEAWNNYRKRKAFSSWPDQWLRNYVDYAFDKEPNGIRISCPPHWEARTFGHTEHKPWGLLNDHGHPTTILAGEKASTFPESEHSRLKRRMPSCHIRILPGTTHFLPMEETQELVNTIISSTSAPAKNSGM